ncbi:Rha family transcriptional regulator [Escherichia coli]|uniref:Rha family transcriptional regulator n=1 Tax=Escherichia coli TaxID=562 RepID=UPI001F2994B0|nr:Rha family transcriptional regulator [Escherichia coli]
MSELMALNGANEVLTMSSLEIADLTGKSHNHVLRDIRNIERSLSGESKIGFIERFNNLGFKIKDSVYYLNKRDTFLLMSGYSAELRARIIDRWLELEKQVQQNAVPNYGNTQIGNVLAFAETASRMLNMSNSGKLGMLQKIEKEYNIPPILPHYAIDAPVDAVDGSSRVTKSLTALLEENNVGMTAREVYPILERKGIVECKYRKARCGEKRFWNVTVYGLRYGKNITNPSNQRETQPHFYESRFKELLNIIFSE